MDRPNERIEWSIEEGTAVVEYSEGEVVMFVRTQTDSGTHHTWLEPEDLERFRTAHQLLSRASVVDGTILADKE